MKIEELIKKPIEIVVENNISEDMIFPHTTKFEFVNRILEKFSGNMENFLFVYVNDPKEKRVRALITLENLSKLTEIIGSEFKKIEDLKLEDSFPPRFEVAVSEPISNIISIFNKEKTDIVIVESVEGKYLGKVRKNKLKEWFNIMVG